uniref:hypothetical protein n=1 Tax=Devosia sp. TaxID=1871048 RepID=UPI002FC69A85
MSDETLGIVGRLLIETAAAEALGMTVEEGGYGAGTVIDVAGRFAGRTRMIRGVVTEPEPGRLPPFSWLAGGLVGAIVLAAVFKKVRER